MLAFVLLLAFMWGCIIAAFMQFTELGDFISKRLTWFMTAIGCGVDLLLGLFLTDASGSVEWWQIVAVFFVSSIAVSFRGIWQHASYNRMQMNDAKDALGE
ncbi:MAG: hypothetical protein DMF06_03350 [Verrucomicrobia bacterium]|nr:MAG: hypothetical protein DMF06_03350 [Verrucomicrobiota bacterium]